MLTKSIGRLLYNGGSIVEADNLISRTITSYDIFVFLYLLYLYPGFYSYTEGATWKILALLTETLLI